MNDAQLADRICDTLERCINVQSEIATLNAQVSRFSTDIESEKRTRADANSRITESLLRMEAKQEHSGEARDKRLSSLEKSVWIGFGATMAVQFLFKYIKL